MILIKIKCVASAEVEEDPKRRKENNSAKIFIAVGNRLFNKAKSQIFLKITNKEKIM